MYGSESLLRCAIILVYASSCVLYLRIWKGGEEKMLFDRVRFIIEIPIQYTSYCLEGLGRLRQ